MYRNARFRLSFIFVLSGFLSGGLQAEPAKYMGTASCASSNCHGSTTASTRSILRNEYVTWQRHGLHTKAYEVLLGSDAKKIGKNLGINAPEKAQQCLTCHATFVSDKKLQGEKYQLEDGVSCESCHGAAEHWIATHTATGRVHADNIRDGMKDIFPLENRARLCTSCHYGDENRRVTHRLIGAGHPRLSFELDTYSILQPKHWEVDEDYIERKGEYDPARAWLVGQVVLAEEVVKTLQSPKHSRDGIFPELTLFNCFACHHDLTSDQWKERDYDGKPGRLRLNIAALLVVREALKELAPALGNELEEKINSLHEFYYIGEGEKILPGLSNLVSARVKPLVLAETYSDDTVLRLLRVVIKFAASRKHLQYEEAEQFAMAMSALISAHSNGATRFKVPLDGVYDALQNSEQFEADEFTSASEKFLKFIK